MCYKKLEESDPDIPPIDVFMENLHSKLLSDIHGYHWSGDYVKIVEDHMEPTQAKMVKYMALEIFGLDTKDANS